MNINLLVFAAGVICGGILAAVTWVISGSKRMKGISAGNGQSENDIRNRIDGECRAMEALVSSVDIGNLDLERVSNGIQEALDALASGLSAHADALDFYYVKYIERFIDDHRRMISAIEDLKKSLLRLGAGKPASLPAAPEPVEFADIVTADIASPPVIDHITLTGREREVTLPETGPETIPVAGAVPSGKPESIFEVLPPKPSLETAHRGSAGQPVTDDTQEVAGGEEIPTFEAFSEKEPPAPPSGVIPSPVSAPSAEAPPEPAPAITVADTAGEPEEEPTLDIISDNDAPEFSIMLEDDTVSETESAEAESFIFSGKNIDSTSSLTSGTDIEKEIKPWDKEEKPRHPENVQEPPPPPTVRKPAAAKTPEPEKTGGKEYDTNSGDMISGDDIIDKIDSFFGFNS